MTIEEKLQHFYDSSVEEAYQEAAQMIEEHKKNLDEMLSEHKSFPETKRRGRSKGRSGKCPPRSKQGAFRPAAHDQAQLDKETERTERQTFYRSTELTGRLCKNPGIRFLSLQKNQRSTGFCRRGRASHLSDPV